jgi:aminoglycoside phosphotransferase (APT) family kinase protein
MDRLPGRANLATAVDDAERDAVLDQYIEAMRRMREIDVREFGAIGLPVPADNRAAALNLYAIGEANYRRAKSAPSPMIEFMWRWMRRNVPAGRERLALLQADSAQFLYENGNMTGLLDFEAAYIGDPVAEFAAMRSRDCAEPLGDIGTAGRGPVVFLVLARVLPEPAVRARRAAGFRRRLRELGRGPRPRGHPVRRACARLRTVARGGGDAGDLRDPGGTPAGPRHGRGGA